MSLLASCPLFACAALLLVACAQDAETETAGATNAEATNTGAEAPQAAAQDVGGAEAPSLQVAGTQAETRAGAVAAPAATSSQAPTKAPTEAHTEATAEPSTAPQTGPEYYTSDADVDATLARFRLSSNPTRFSAGVYAALPFYDDGIGTLHACDIRLGESLVKVEGGVEYTGPCYQFGTDGPPFTVLAPANSQFGGGVVDITISPDGYDSQTGGAFLTTVEHRETELRGLERLEPNSDAEDCWGGEEFYFCTRPVLESERIIDPADANVDHSRPSPREAAQREAAAVMARFHEGGANSTYSRGVYAELPKSGPNGSRLVRCTVSQIGEYYRGPCYFLADETGGFSLERPDGEAFGGAVVVNVAKTGLAPDTAMGAADVRGLTRDGINSRWGAAARSEFDPACWGGTDFEVCAYGL